MSVCLSALNLRGLTSHDHETWHVGPLSDLDVQGPSEILISGRDAPQALAAFIFCLKSHDLCLKSKDHEIWHVGPLSDLE